VFESGKRRGRTFNTGLWQEGVDEELQKIRYINSHINHRSSNSDIYFGLDSSRHMPKTFVLRTTAQVWEKHKCFDDPVYVSRNGQVDASS
jgi:hypothetical protein